MWWVAVSHVTSVERSVITVIVVNGWAGVGKVDEEEISVAPPVAQAAKDIDTPSWSVSSHGSDEQDVEEYSRDLAESAIVGGLRRVGKCLPCYP